MSDPPVQCPKTPRDSTVTPRTGAPMETAFQQLAGRLPTEAERARLYAVRDTLRLRETDAVWALFVALEHYHALYERFPPMIRAAAHDILVEFKTETDALLQNAAADLDHTARALKGPLVEATHEAGREARQEFVAATRQRADRAVRRVRLERFWPWLLGGAVIMALALTIGIGVGFGYGRQQGYTVGYTEGYTLGVQQTPVSASAPHRPLSPTQPGR